MKVSVWTMESLSATHGLSKATGKKAPNFRVHFLSLNPNREMGGPSPITMHVTRTARRRLSSDMFGPSSGMYPPAQGSKVGGTNRGAHLTTPDCDCDISNSIATAG